MLDLFDEPKLEEKEILFLSKKYFLPAIHNVYHKFYLESYSSVTKKWPILARSEFPESMPLSKDFKLVDRVASAGLMPPFGKTEVLKGGLFCHVYTFKKQNIITFRGSAGLLDWLRNSMAYMVPLTEEEPDVKVHAGFLQIFQDLEPLLKEYQQEGVWMTGHSLGAAIATFFAQSTDFPKAKLLTYGSPRVGNEEFIKRLKANTQFHFRVETENDPIPFLPLEVKPMGGLFDYKDGGDLIRLPLANATIVDKLKAHLPSVYLQAIDQALDL